MDSLIDVHMEVFSKMVCMTRNEQLYVINGGDVNRATTVFSLYLVGGTLMFPPGLSQDSTKAP